MYERKHNTSIDSVGDSIEEGQFTERVILSLTNLFQTKKYTIQQNMISKPGNQQQQKKPNGSAQAPSFNTAGMDSVPTRRQKYLQSTNYKAL